MDAKELFDRSDLAAAIVALNDDIKRHPTDARLRTFLFELLCFAGEYERAHRQLEVLGSDSSNLAGGTSFSIVMSP